MQGRLKLIIDLTNTSRFYNKDEIERRGVSYVKMACRGHGETPDELQTKTFITICKNIFSQPNDDPSKPFIIGIHCTHGFNRTGFLIVSYLVQEEGWDLTSAIGCFAAARPPGIYKQDYLDQLASLYNFGEDITFAAPELPSWCFEGGVETPDNNAIDEPQQESQTVSKLSSNSLVKIEEERQKALTKDIVQLCPGVVPADAENWIPVRKAVSEYLGWNKNGFAGAQPVSFDKSSIEKIKTRPFMVSWKADGTRYMMYINEDGKVFMIDRDNCVFFVPKLDFPRKPSSNSNETFLTRTLMDGELVVDKPAENVLQPRYLVYDLMVLNGCSLVNYMFPRRMSLLRSEVMEVRDRAAAEQRLDKSKQSFSVRLKLFNPIEGAKYFTLPKFTSQVSHGIDGLIFQPCDEPYMAGRCDSILKWKPQVENTIDFRLRIVSNTAKPKPGELPPPSNIGELLVGCGRGQERKVDAIKLTRDLRQYKDKIIECCYDKATREWKFTRERIDKSFPNSYETAIAVMRSINDPVTSELLFAIIDRLPEHLKKSQPPPNQQQQQQQLAKKRPAPAPPPPLFNGPDHSSEKNSKSADE